MEGSRGTTKWLNLENHDRDDFEDGNTDVFKLAPQKPVGDFKQAWMKIRGTDGWKCRDVVIRQLDGNGNEKSTKNLSTIFDCGWLDEWETKRLPWW